MRNTVWAFYKMCGILYIHLHTLWVKLFLIFWSMKIAFTLLSNLKLPCIRTSLFSSTSMLFLLLTNWYSYSLRSPPQVQRSYPFSTVMKFNLGLTTYKIWYTVLWNRTLNVHHTVMIYAECCWQCYKPWHFKSKHVVLLLLYRWAFY